VRYNRSSPRYSRLIDSLEHTLMRWAFELEGCSGWLTGRRIAILSTRLLSIVAPETRPGDEIHEYYDNREFRLLVLRPYSISAAVSNHHDRATKRDDRWTDWGSVRHFTLVGLAWVEDVWDEDWSLDLRDYSRHKNRPDMRTTACLH
jgi:hypothetical protein